MKESVYPTAGGKKSICNINHIITSDGIAAAGNKNVPRNKQEILYNQKAKESNSDDAEKPALQTGLNSINVIHYNNLKPRLERAERLNVFLQSSGKLWESKCSRLKKELEDAIVSNECKRPCSFGGQTLSTSASRNQLTRKKIEMRNSEKDCGKLKKDIPKMDISFEL